MSTISNTRTNVSVGSNGDTAPLTITATGTVTNTGTYSSVTNAYGVILNNGTIRNTVPAGTPAAGINQGPNALTVTNTGLISASQIAIQNGFAGIPLYITNTSTGRITSGGRLLTSAGRISGQSTALSFTDGNDLLTLRNGYSFGAASPRPVPATPYSCRAVPETRSRRRKAACA